MILDPQHKIERLDKNNIALFKKRSKGEKWDPIMFFKTFHEGLRGSLKYLTLDQIAGSGTIEDLETEYKECKIKIGALARIVGSQMDSIEGVLEKKLIEIYGALK